MQRRSRSRFAVVAMAALALSFAEGVLASACASMATRHAPGPGAATARGDGGLADHAAGGSHDPAHHDNAPDAPDCPLGPGAAQGCRIAASLPSPLVVAVVLAAEGREQFVLPAAPPRHLVGTGLFRPPRA